IKGFLEHVDLLLVKRGEKVTVEVPVNATGDVASGGRIEQPVIEIAVEAEATRIPEAVEVDVTGLQIGQAVLAKDLKLSEGVSLAADEETLILQIEDASAAVGPVEETAEEEAAEGE